MTNLNAEIVARVFDVLANNVIYDLMPEGISAEAGDDRSDALHTSIDSDALTEQVVEALRANPFCTEDRMLQLAEQIGVADLFSEESWVDAIADFGYEHRHQFTNEIAVVDRLLAQVTNV
jgi:hypothetical protein